MQSAYRMKLQGYSPQYAFPFLKGSEEERKYLSEKEVKKIINMIYFSGIELSGTHSSSENTAIYKLCMNGWKSPQFTPLK